MRAQNGIITGRAILVAAVFVFSALPALAQRDLVVSPKGSGTHITIQSAIDAAEPGATIQINPGTYAESLFIDKPIAIRATGPREVVLTASRAYTAEEVEQTFKEVFGPSGPPLDNPALIEPVLAEFGFPLLRVRNTAGVTISGLRITHPAKGSRNGGPSYPLVSFDAAEASLTDSAVLGGLGNGIAIQNGSSVTVSNCLVAAQWRAGIAIGGREDVSNRALVTDSEIRNCFYACLTIRGDRAVRIQRSRISGAAWHGVRYDDSSPAIHGCLIFGNERSGIYASGKTSADIQNNVFWGNRLSAWFDNQDLIQGNTFYDQRSGIGIISRSAPTIRSNIFHGSQTAIGFGLTKGIRPDELPPAHELVIEGNVFWKSAVVLGAARDAEPEVSRAADSILAAFGNLDADPGLDNIARDFRPSAEFRESYPTVGSTAPFPAESRWPLQPEEKAIIPEGLTRDYKLWKSE